jgi:hypothetical protein
MSELYEDLLWFRQMDNDMEDFVKSCGGVEGHAQGLSTLGESGHVHPCPAPRRSEENERLMHTRHSSENQASPAGIRITEAPEPHEPTKVLGWLLVGFAGFCVYVLGATIFKFWPVIVRTLK